MKGDVHTVELEGSPLALPANITIQTEAFEPCQHLEVKITDEGIIIELWDEEEKAFSHIWSSTFGEMLEQDEQEDEE
jgi:hypothetical protein